MTARDRFAGPPGSTGPGEAPDAPADSAGPHADGPHGAEPAEARLEVYGDSAYGSGEARAAYRDAGLGTVIKPGPLRPAVPGGFTAGDFTIGEQAGTRRLGGTPEGVQGPAGRITAQHRAAGGDRAAGASDRAAGAGDLLEALRRGEDGHGLTDAEIADEVATFLLAGHETSANALSWTLALLLAYPAARDRLEAELDTVLGDRDPDPGDAGKLPWARAVISEALRLYPPAWTVERDALADDEVAGVRIPAGSLVAVPPYLVHRHREFWPDPAGFDPRRFLPGGCGDPAARHRYAFIPFGGGRRACIGASFAELETVLVLATVARRFRLELTTPGMPRPAAYVTLRPRGGLPMRLHRR